MEKRKRYSGTGRTREVKEKKRYGEKKGREREKKGKKKNSRSRTTWKSNKQQTTRGE